MISIGRLGLGHAEYYLTEVVDGREDYFVVSAEVPGRWSGALAERLGLDGVIDQADLRSIFEGVQPGTDTRLRSNQVGRVAFDFTLSVPKSVSLMWALGDDHMATEVVAAVEAANGVAIDFLEREACGVRRGHAGADHLPGEGFVVASFRHGTSRAGDPSFTSTTSSPTSASDPTDGSRRSTPSSSTGGVSPPATSSSASCAASWPPGSAPSSRRSSRAPATSPASPGGPQGVLAAPRRDRRLHGGARHDLPPGGRVRQPPDPQDQGPWTDEPALRAEWRQRVEGLGFDMSTLMLVPRPVVLDVDDATVAWFLTDSDATFARQDAYVAVARLAGEGADLAQLDERVDRSSPGPPCRRVAGPAELWTTPEYSPSSSARSPSPKPARMR